MKKWYFIKWLARQVWENIKSWDRWIWGWFVTCMWGPNAVMHREEEPNNYFAFIWFVLIFWIGYGLIYTGIKRAYQKFLDEQERMVEHLKNIG